MRYGVWGMGHGAWGMGHERTLVPHCLMPRASCLMPHAPCLMPHASCLMPHASYRNHQKLRRYVKMNSRGTQFRIGATNFDCFISRCARKASDSSPVELLTTFVETTSPFVLT